MAKRKRDIPMLFYVSEQEKEMIQKKMDEYGTGELKRLPLQDCH